jgi:hypothetical protein
MGIMSWNRPWIRVASVGALLLLLCWVVLWRGSSEVEGGDGTTGRSGRSRPNGQRVAQPREDRTPKHRDSQREGGDDRTPALTSTGPTATLRILVKREDGKPASGIVTWSTSATHPLTGSALAVFSSSEGEASNGVHQTAYEAEATLRVPADQWIWARVSAGGNPLAGWYLRVSPFRGEKVETLYLSHQKRTLHVFALNSEMTGPAMEQEVGIYSVDMRNPGPPELLKKLKTDENGYVRVGGLEPGGFFVSGPDAGPKDRHPHCVRLMLPVKIPAVETPCTVVAMPKMQLITLRIEADLQAQKSTGMRPKLYLKRKDDGSGHPYPVPTVLQAGKQTCVVRVPPGTYELGALPLGRFVLECSEGFLDVQAGEDPVFAVKVAENEVTTSLELSGIPPDHFPVIVHPRRCDGVVDEDPKLFFVGRYRWRVSAQTVPVLDFRCRLIALGKGGAYIADRELQMTRSSVSVGMKPACMVHVRLFGPEAVRSGDVVAVTTVGSEQVVTRLRRDMVRDGVELKPALVGTVVMPRGQLQVECARPDGSVLWRGEQDARGPSVVVSVKAE